jgi:leader peptidase (prepilin peptidase)/N-methyltransferase
MLVTAMRAFLLPLVLAPFVGSFLGVVIERLPAGRPIGFARSTCDACGRTLSFGDLIPIGSFAALGGRCRSCGTRIAPFHLYVELAAIGTVLWAATAEPDPWPLWADCTLGWMLLALGWIDWRHFRLPDALTLPLILAGLAATAANAPERLADHAAGAVAGYLLFRILNIAYRRLRGRDGLGEGDAKLLAAAGAWTGLLALPSIVFYAAGIGLVAALPSALQAGRWDGALAIPFGAPLALAIWLVRLYGTPFV